MCDSLSAHILGNQTIEVLEENFDPDNLFSCLKHPRYHSTLCGCSCEMISIPTDCRGLIINKRCLTHDVMCSKSGWELGWWAGTDTKAINPVAFDYKICECGRKFIKSKFHDYCHRCEPSKYTNEEKKIRDKIKLNDDRKNARIWHFKKQGLSDSDIDNIFREEEKVRLEGILK